MPFDDFSEEFLTFQQSSFDSPDLRPIFLPMTATDKESLEGMINLSTAGTAFPNSNAFGSYLQLPYSAEQHPNVHNGSNREQDNAQDYYADGDYYPANLIAQQNMLAMQHNNAQVELPIHGNQAQAHKRKRSADLEYIAPHPQKKAIVTQLQLPDTNCDYHNASGEPSPYYTPVIPNSGSMVYPSIHVPGSPRSRHQYSASNASQVSVPAPSPHTPAWSPSFTAIQTEHSPGGPMTPAPRPASTTASYQGDHPKLVRTSTISQQASPSMNPSACTGVYTHAFNPYTVYPQSKANLVLHGDLDGVALDWSAEELEARRKLVVFTRSQSGSTINADFKTVAPQDWQRSDITINCIWWEEKQEAYVTSVDTIALLEQLVGVRFTVEEKNRIRRNLEGFHPLTVSKAKGDSEEFFKVIMGFSMPKPRNIEKDVKVFSWSILAHALTKIIGKYSASYASTASTINTPAPSAYASPEHSGEYQFVPSPHHETFSFSMPVASIPVTCCESAMPAATTSAPFTTGIPDLSARAPGMAIPYEMVPHAFSYQQMPMMSPAMAPHPVTAPIDRMQTGWVYPIYEAQTMGPMSVPTAGYLHSHIEAGAMVAPRHQMHQR